MSKEIDSLLTPVEVQQELEGNAFLTADQATYIASEVYQPLYLALKGVKLELRSLKLSLKKSAFNQK